MNDDVPPEMLADGCSVPVHVVQDRTLRVKITDACGMTCTFCHNEGTPVTADNRGLPAALYRANGPSGRSSIYLSSNGAAFLSSTVPADDKFLAAVTVLRDALDLDEVHLTGGEPTLHPRLPDLVELLRGADLRVRMTSNGETGMEPVRRAAAAGLESVSFSVFGTTPAQLSSVQSVRDPSREWAERKIAALASAVHTALACGIEAHANIVVPDASHRERVHHLLQRFGTELSVRLLNSLADGRASLDAIETILDELNAVPVSHQLIAGSSGWRTTFQMPGGRTVHVKRIRPTRLPGVCETCRFNNPEDCQEGYYGVRLYRDRDGVYQVGVCLRRMDLCLPVHEFASSELPGQIVALRQNQYRQLAKAAPHIA